MVACSMWLFHPWLVIGRSLVVSMPTNIMMLSVVWFFWAYIYIYHFISIFGFLVTFFGTFICRTCNHKFIGFVFCWTPARHKLICHSYIVHVASSVWLVVVMSCYTRNGILPHQFQVLDVCLLIYLQKCGIHSHTCYIYNNILFSSVVENRL